MGYWKIVRPIAATNLITNPSLEIDATGHSDSGSNTVARSTEQASAGAASLKCTYQDNLTLNNYDISLDAGTYLFYARVYIPSNWDGGAISISQTSLAGTTTTLLGSITSTGAWHEVAMLHVMAGTDIGSITIVTASAPTAGRYIYVDCMMCIAATRLQTYIDGDMPGCYWNGTAHVSTSTRSQFDRRGGEVLDFETDLYFKVRTASGAGMVESKNLAQPISNQGGASYDGNQTQPRHMILNGIFNAGGTSLPTYHSRKRTLLKCLNPKTNTDVDETPLPVILRYTGGETTKEISAYYDGGLENDPDQPVIETAVSLRFFSVDPFFYEINRPAATLTSTDSTTFSVVARRIGSVQNVSSDLWDSMGPPNASGTYSFLHALAEDDTYIYVGGDFLNFDNIANADRVARWHKANRAWSALGTGMDGVVYDLFVAPSGTLYAAGGFTTAGGTTCRGIASWNGSAWAALGPPSSGGDVYTVTVDTDGIVYIGGTFTNFDGIANADRVASWNGSAWSALSTGMDAQVNRLKVYNNLVYASGSFTTAGGTTASRMATWNGSAWSAISTAVFDGAVDEIVFDSGGNFYAGGTFTNIDSDTNLKRCVYWNGQGFVSLDGGMSAGSVVALAIDDDGILYAGGSFTSAGTLSTLGDGIARWNGSSWSHADINFAGAGVILCLLISRQGDLYLGMTSSGIGTGTYGGATTLSYSGSAENYPVITVKRTGGTTARLISIRNETTDAELMFDYSLSNGETITIELNPFLGAGVSSSFIGDVPGAILPGNDSGSFYLDPGNGDGSKSNIVTCYITTSGSPTVTALMYYRNAYLSQD